nr:MAG TPA: hypothetical protein [Caudoviricetes sp.]
MSYCSLLFLLYSITYHFLKYSTFYTFFVTFTDILLVFFLKTLIIFWILLLEL